VKYLPLFHHFKAIYQFPKHIIFLVKIVANASLTMKLYCKRQSNDYTLRLQATIHYISDCQQAPIHCNSCITIFDPNFLSIATTYKNLSLHVKSIYERLLKNVYFNIITVSNIL
jgi:hypothetical protein